MRKTRTSYEQAVMLYNEFFGKAPTASEINDLYHRYAFDWKHYDGFTDWMMNNVDC